MTISNRFRFSLTTLVLLTTIIALAATVGVIYRELGPLRAEVRQYRDQLGILTINDPKVVHAIRLPTEDNEPRRYRVYLPEGRDYWLHYNQYSIPTRGVTASHSSNRLGAGEYLIAVSFE